MSQRPRAQAADPGLAEADLRADLPERQAARERQHEDLPFDGIDVPELARDPRPTPIPLGPT
jgi:hypothetical protein